MDPVQHAVGDIVVIGASAGGIETLIRLVRGLRPDLRSSLFVVCHMPASHPSQLAVILSRHSALPVVAPAARTPIEVGHVYVARADRHLVVREDAVCCVMGPKQNHARPAIDPLFRSAALAFGPRVVGVLLSGFLDDGVAGLGAIRARGGTVVVQNPDDALYPDMPNNALRAMTPDHVIAVDGMGALLYELSVTPREYEASDPSAELTREVALVSGEAVTPMGRPSPYSCPECGGVLWENDGTSVPAYECRVGHAFTADNLATYQRDATEAALWAAVRAIDERGSYAADPRAPAPLARTRPARPGAGKRGGDLRSAFAETAGAVPRRGVVIRRSRALCRPLPPAAAAHVWDGDRSGVTGALSCFATNSRTRCPRRTCPR